MRHDFTSITFDRLTRDRRSANHWHLYCGTHRGTPYYLPTMAQAVTTSADYAYVRRLGRTGNGEVFSLGELRERYAGLFIPEYAPDRHADGGLRAGNDAPLDPCESWGCDDEAGATLSREHVRDVLVAQDDEIGSANVDAILRRLGVSRPEPYKIVTVEVKVKYTADVDDAQAASHAAELLDTMQAAHPARAKVVSVEATGVEEVR